MTPYIASIAIDQVIIALDAFLTPFIAPAKTVRGQNNRTPPPKGAYVLLTEMGIVDIETPTSVNDGVAQQALISGPAKIAIQIDFYGPSSGDWCKAVMGVYRSPYAPAQFPDGIKPLFCSDGHQGPLVTGEQQYQSRWTLTAYLQYNPVVAVPLQSANVLKMGPIKNVNSRLSS